MATNSLLTKTEVTRRALAILHQKLNFVRSINRQYDDSFARSGAKIGDSLKIRLPNEYTVRTNATLAANDTAEMSTTLQVANQYGVDVSFTSAELSLSIDDFSQRILEPAMAVLASKIESVAYGMYKDVYNVVDNDAAVISFLNIMQGRQKLNDCLAPDDGNRSALLSTTHTVKLINELKGLFHDSSAVKQQYRDGVMGRTGGFDFMESTHASLHTTGTCAKTTGYAVNGNQTTNGLAQVLLKTGANTFAVGDVFTVAGTYRVHPETKVSTGELQQFVVTEAYAGGAGSVKFAPAIYTSGARQNVVATGFAADSAVVKVAAGASETMSGSMVYHRDAFAFATADLVVPEGVDFARREVYDGISMRLVRQYSISDDTFPCRIDVLWGCKTIRPQLACRIHADG